MTSTRCWLVLSIAVVLCGLAGAAEPDESGFVPLFDGKTLDGWVNVNCHPSTFFVKDNEIVTTGKPTGFLRTAKQYENFILHLEWKHVETEKMANSGLFVWGDPLPATGTPYTRGIEVQVLANAEVKDSYTSDGDVFAIHGATCQPDRPHPKGAMRCLPSEKRTRPAGQWNHYQVIARDGTIKLHVNGKEVSGVSQCQPRKGYLALESEGAECHFRNIRIKELPSTSPKPDQVANVDQGHKQLFNGLDLTGWKTDRGAWTVANGHLRPSGKANLVSEGVYGQYELMFDWKLPAKSKAEFELELGTSQVLAMTDANADHRGRWNRAVVTVGKDGVSQTLNGRPGTKSSFVPGPGPITFKPAEGLEVMNVFIREIR